MRDPVRRTPTWPAFVVAAVALCCRLVPVLRGGGLVGKDVYDPSVYYAAAVGLATGRLPYRDFLLLHPPGVLLVLQPFVAIGTAFGDPFGMASARVGFMLMGAASTVLVYRLLLRQSLAAALAGASLYAVWFPAIYSERSVFLESLGTLLLLLGVTAVLGARPGTRGSVWTVLGGVALGFSACVKIWGVVPLAALAAWLWWRRGRSAALRFTLGSAAAVVAVCLPFAVLGPQMWRMVVLDQLARTPPGAGPLERLRVILGLGPVPASVGVLPLVLAAGVTLVAVRVALGGVDGQLYVVLTAACSATLLVESTWFSHYAAFAAAPLCLLFGTAAGWLAGVLAAPRTRRVVLGAGLASLAVVAGLWTATRIGSDMQGERIGEILAGRQGCVTTDNPATLILSGTLRRNLSSGCPLVVDLGGYVLDFARRDGTTSVRPENAAFQEFAMSYLRSGTSTMVVRFGLGGFTPANLRTIDSWAVVGQAGRTIVRQPAP